MQQNPVNLDQLNTNLEAQAEAEALKNKSALMDFEDFLPTVDHIVSADQVNGQTRSNLRRQMQMALSSIQSMSTMRYAAIQGLRIQRLTQTSGLSLPKTSASLDNTRLFISC